MKNLFLFLSFLIFVQTVNSQSFVKSFPESYNSNVNHTTTLNDGTVILAIRNSGVNTNYREINSFKALDNTGAVTWEANLSQEGNYAGSFYHILDMKASPDGGWLVSGGMFDCDYYPFGFVVKFNADFEEEWIVKSHEVLPNGYVGEFYRLQVSDEKLHLYSFSDIVTLDYSGNLLEHIDLSNSYFSFVVANETQIYAYTTELGWHILSYPEGNLTDEELPLPNEFSRIEVINEEENIFAVFGFQEGMKIFQSFTEILEVPNDPNLERTILFDTNTENFGIAKLYTDSTLISLHNGLDASLIANEKFTLPDDIEISTFSAVDNQIIAAGKERYVPISYYEKKNVAIAFSQNIGTTTDFPQPILDLGISNLSVANPVATSVFDIFSEDEGQQYNFMDIEMSITNNSSEEINSYAVNTSFEPSIYTFFCDPFLDYRLRIENTILAPGESQTIYIDALTTYAVNDTAGYQLCFWVTHPNNKPDLVAENDISCTDFIKDTTSSTENIVARTPLIIHPNPTTDYLYVGEDYSFEDCAILNSEGKKIKTGYLDEGQRIDVRKLAKGIYFLQVSSDKDRRNLKFIKQ